MRPYGILRSHLLLLLVLSFVALSQSVQAQTTVFSYTGSDQLFQVPAGADFLFVQIWGGGGGGASGQSAQSGGGGAYVSGYIMVVPNELLTIRVGEGGILGSGFGYGHGGSAGSALAGGGGGLSGIARGTTYLALAGAGGGAGASSGFSGGAGGLTTGSPASGTGGGGGGTQSAGGSAGGIGASAGSSFIGGNGGSNGGGGGSGYYGGGGGGLGAGGGGGSSYTGLITSGFFGVGGSGSTAGGELTPFYITGVGVGGTELAGGNGEVAITPFNTLPVPEPATWFVGILASLTTVAVQYHRRSGRKTT